MRLDSDLCYGLVDLQQCGEALAHFIKQFGWSDAGHFDVSLLPGDTAHLVHQNEASNSVRMWNGNFKRIPRARLVIGQMIQRPDRALYCRGVRTIAGRCPLCSWPTVGFKSIQIRSPASGQ
jgi:hypothetical protein